MLFRLEHADAYKMAFVRSDYRHVLLPDDAFLKEWCSRGDNHTYAERLSMDGKKYAYVTRLFSDRPIDFWVVDVNTKGTLLMAVDAQLDRTEEMKPVVEYKLTNYPSIES